MKKLVIFISSAIFILVLVIIFGFRIKLTNKDIELELNSSFEEPGYGYYFYGKKLNKKFDIKGDVDTSKVGEYEITYTTKFLLKHTKKRIVRIREYEKPVITLEGNGYVCPTKEYIEEGYKAIDNYDGDITDKVIVIKNANEIIYEVTDTSGNKTQIKRPIIYDDIENPSIKLIDGNIKLKKNEEYKEPGYQAIDNCLGDITDKVTIEGSIDTSKVGSYVLTYKVDDGKNNIEEKRYISVYDTSLPSTSYVNTVSKKGVIYLTFDDGPEYGITDQILDTLKKYNVLATFFIVPKNSNNYYLIKREYDEGHSIGIHTNSHNYSVIYSSDEALYNDINAVNNKIKSITGNYSYLYRYPGGSSNTVSRSYTKGIISRSSSVLHNLGYHYFDWNISSTDAASPTPSKEHIANQVISNLSKSRANVVLMHDTKLNTANALEDIIKYGLENGYIFERIEMNTAEVHHGINN